MADASYQDLLVAATDQFTAFGFDTYHAYLPPIPEFSHVNYQGSCLITTFDGPCQMIGATTFTGPEGYTSLPYFILPPVIEWRLHPRVRPPMQFSTLDGSLVGQVDGKNDTFTTSVLLSRWRVFKNGVSMELGFDCAAPDGSAFLKFLPGSIPRPGDVITVSGWSNL